ncbi:MAG: DM13 domain-containing protein [Candidatus Promineifilaceae bacterium]
MRNRSLLISAAIALFLGGVAAAWYLFSPLLVDDPVDEAFPFEAPAESEVAGLSPEERADLEAAFATAVPVESALAALNEGDRREVEERVMEAAALVMMDHEMDDDMPREGGQPAAISQGEFIGADDFHQGSGAAIIYELPDGQRLLRLEDFEVTNGPDLHVLLAAHPAPTSRADVGEDYVDLGELKGNLGDQNYEVPAQVDLSRYQSVVIYCKPFHVVFASASLLPAG